MNILITEICNLTRIIV